MSKIFDCPTCHLLLGQTKTVGNIELLQINGVIIRELRGFCTNCGSEIRYSVSDAYLKSIIERTITPIDVGKGGLLDKEDKQLENSEVKK